MSLLGLVLANPGCLQSPDVACGDGTICSADQACLTTSGQTFCATPQQIAECIDKEEGDSCGEKATLHRCLNGFCQPSLCGNDVINPEVGETCEAGVAIDALTCLQRGYDDGVVACSECTLNTDSCARYCGDGFVDDDEECDGEAFNPQLATTCEGTVPAPELGAVTCTRDCRIDVTQCHSVVGIDRVVTLPPIPVAALPIAAFAVDGNEVWVVEAVGTVSYFAHWTGDRWRRAKIATAFEKTATCDAIWATHGAAFAACDDGSIVEFQRNSGASAAVGAASQKFTGIWGFAVDNVWAAKGSTIWHYNGSQWTPDLDWAALGAANTGTVLSVGGDTNDLFVLTDEALFRRNSAGAWALVLTQPGFVGSPFAQISVFDETHVWLLTSVPNGSAFGPEVKLFNGTNVVTDIPVNVSSDAKLVAASADAFYIADSSKRLRRYAATRFEEATPYPFVEVETIVAPANVLTVGANSVWMFGDSLSVTFRSALVETLELRDRFNNSLLAGPNIARHDIAQGLDGRLYFSVSDSKLFVMGATTEPLTAVTFTDVGTVEAIAPIAEPANHRLLVLAGQQLRVLFEGSGKLDEMLTPLPNVRGLWSDGRKGFVIANNDLFAYQGHDPGTWPRLAGVHPGAVLLTGGRVNETDTVWAVTTAALDASQRLQRFTIVNQSATTDEIALPPVIGLLVNAVWSHGPDLWIAGSVAASPVPYLARWSNGRWLEYAVPLARGTPQLISQLWSDQPGHIWLRTGARSLLHFDGSRWTRSDKDDDDIGSANLGTLRNYSFADLPTGPAAQLWMLVEANVNATGNTGIYHLGHLDNPHPPLTGGACPAQQELFCRESGHGVTEGPRTIATIVGGRFGAAHYVLNSTLSGRIRFEGQLPAGVEAIWALPDSSGTCPPGASLAFAPNGTSQRAEQTLGPSRYFLTLRSRNFADPLDKTEYPVALDYSCNRVD